MIIGWRGWEADGQPSGRSRRWWSTRCHDPSLRLRSPYQRAWWPHDRPMVAETCLERIPDYWPDFGEKAQQHPLAQPRCMCGIYANRSRQRTLQAARRCSAWDGPPRSPVTGEWLVGQVGLWGRVVEHELGWRATHARVLSLILDDEWWESPFFTRHRRHATGIFPSPDTIAAMAGLYGVPVLNLSELRQLETA